MKGEFDPVDAVAQLSFLVQNTLAAHAAERDLSLAQTRLLGVLRDRTPSMNELAGLLEVDKSSVTGLVSRAEKRGLVARTPSARDGRSTVVTLTASGRRLIRSVSTRFSADLEDILSTLPAAQQRTLTTLLGRVILGHAARRGIDLFDTQTPEQ